MLSRPVPRYPPYSSHSTSTTYLPASHFLPHGLSMDPSSVDFRAFYPYTPNEVKHRKRTTTTQLRTLEAVFKRDTKPNGPLRVDLAAQLGMTARGVQVCLCCLFVTSNSWALSLGLVSKSVCAFNGPPLIPLLIARQTSERKD